tara:strand:+ start:402 stop:617 length:216 start_codon:yes stop_codon:yes gene_type:complete
MDIEQRIIKLENSVELILTKLNEIKKDTNRMDSHISFVENVYNNIKLPFNYLMNFSEKLLVKNNYKLIEDK